MDELRLRSRSVSEIVDAAFALYRRDAGHYMLLVAIAHIPTLLAKLLLPNVSVNSITATDFSALGTLLWTGVVTLLVTAFSYTLAAASVLKYSSDVYLGESANIESTIEEVMPKLVSVIVANFLKGLLYFLGLLCLGIGVFYVMARWFAVQAVVVLEGKGALEAFGRSSELSDGRKRHILNTILLVGIIYFVLSFGVGFVAGLTKSTVIALILTYAYDIVASPVILLTSMVLYYDCRIRGEGFDLERMAAAMGAAGVTLQQAADSARWSVAQVHDTVAAIARQSPYERSLGASAMQRFFTWLNEQLNAAINFFKGSAAGRHITTAIVIVIVIAIIVNVVISTVASKSDVVSADAAPGRARQADAWREAQRLAAAGRFTDASHALLAALLWTFAQRGEVRLHSSKTAGDYARELSRRGSPARDSFQQFRRRYDEVIFGVGECSADEYTALLRAAEPMLARAGIS